MEKKKNKSAIISMIGCAVIGLVYVGVLLKLVVFKNGFTTSFRGFNIIPCRFVVDLISKEMTCSVFLKNVLGNIAVFVPLGILLPVLFKKLTIKNVIRIGFLVSLAIELSQLIIGLGICDIDDLFTNTIGVLVGAVLYQKLTKYWDEHWENSYATFMMLCFIGISSASLLFFFGYGSHLVETPMVKINEEIISGLDENKAIDFRCENIEDSKLIGFQHMYDENGQLSGSRDVSYQLNQDTNYYLHNIKASYSINGNVNKVTVTYSKISKDDFLELIKDDGIWADVWTNDSNECYAVMATVHEG